MSTTTTLAKLLKATSLPAGFEDLESFEGELRAVGLLSGDVDLVEAVGTLQDEGSLAFYDPESERITVRGSDLTPRLRVTLVHELTHAV